MHWTHQVWKCLHLSSPLPTLLSLRSVLLTHQHAAKWLSFLQPIGGNCTCRFKHDIFTPKYHDKIWPQYIMHNHSSPPGTYESTSSSGGRCFEVEHFPSQYICEQAMRWIRTSTAANQNKHCCNLIKQYVVKSTTPAWQKLPCFRVFTPASLPDHDQKAGPWW